MPRKSTRFTDVIVFSVGLILALLVGELGLERLTQRPLPRSWRELPAAETRDEMRHLGVSPDDRTLPEIAKALRATVVVRPWEQWRRFRDRQPVPLRAKGLALAGVSDSPTIFCNENGEYLAYQSDERGFHNPPGLHRAGVELALVGDDTIHGACVRPGQTIGARLRKQIPRTVSLGMAGSGPLAELGILAEYAAPLRPKQVVWFFYEGDDLRELADEAAVPELRDYLKPGFNRGLARNTAELDTIQKEAAAEILATGQLPVPGISLRRIATFDATRTIYRRYILGQGTSTTAAQWELLGKIWGQAQQRVKGWGGEFRVVLLPSRLSVTNARAFREERLQASRLLDALKIPYQDLLPAFQAHTDPSSLFPFGGYFHYNAEGHLLVAEKVGEWLREPGARHASLQ